MSIKSMIVRFMLSVICYLIFGLIMKFFLGNLGLKITIGVLIIDVLLTSFVIIKSRY